MQDQTEVLVDKKALLANAARVPAGAKLEECNPLEKIPTLTVGDDGDIVTGTVINGFYEGHDIIASPKFTHSKEKNLQGVPIQLLHKFRLTDGSMVGIWNTGELKAALASWPLGEFISLKYNGKGKNAKGQDQHFFEYAKLAGAGQ